MSDNNEEGKQVEQGGTQANTPPSASQAQPSVDLAALMARMEKLENENRSLQSGKDKRWNQVMPVIEQVAEVLGLDKEQVAKAQEKAILAELVAERMGKQPSAPSATGTSAPAAARVEVSTLVDALGLDMADPGVTALAATITDPNELVAAIGRYAKKKAASPTPNTAQTPVTPGLPPARDVPLETLMANYQKELGTARGNQKLFHEIQEKYRKLGLDPGTVVFH